MRGRLAILGAPDVHFGPDEVNGGPFEVNNLGSPKAVAVGNQDHCGVALAIAIAPGGLDQLCDSAGVRCSRFRYSLFGRRCGATARFLPVGVTSLRCALACILALSDRPLLA